MTTKMTCTNRPLGWNNNKNNNIIRKKNSLVWFKDKNT